MYYNLQFIVVVCVMMCYLKSCNIKNNVKKNNLVEQLIRQDSKYMYKLYLYSDINDYSNITTENTKY